MTNTPLGNRAFNPTFPLAGEESDISYSNKCEWRVKTKARWPLFQTLGYDKQMKHCIICVEFHRWSPPWEQGDKVLCPLSLPFLQINDFSYFSSCQGYLPLNSTIWMGFFLSVSCVTDDSVSLVFRLRILPQKV